MVQVWCVLLTHDKHDGMHEQPIGVKRLEISLARTSANATGDEREREACQRSARRPCVRSNRGDSLDIVGKCSSLRGAHDAATYLDR